MFLLSWDRACFLQLTRRKMYESNVEIDPSSEPFRQLFVFHDTCFWNDVKSSSSELLKYSGNVFILNFSNFSIDFTCIENIARVPSSEIFIEILVYIIDVYLHLLIIYYEFDVNQIGTISIIRVFLIIYFMFSIFPSKRYKSAMIFKKHRIRHDRVTTRINLRVLNISLFLSLLLFFSRPFNYYARILQMLLIRIAEVIINRDEKARGKAAVSLQALTSSSLSLSTQTPITYPCHNFSTF